MKKGDTVTIYEDPITETRQEGAARLISQIDRGTRASYVKDLRLERWNVRFLYEKRTVERAILNKETGNER